MSGFVEGVKNILACSSELCRFPTVYDDLQTDIQEVVSVDHKQRFDGFNVTIGQEMLYGMLVSHGLIMTASPEACYELGVNYEDDDVVCTAFANTNKELKGHGKVFIGESFDIECQGLASEDLTTGSIAGSYSGPMTNVQAKVVDGNMFGGSIVQQITRDISVGGEYYFDNKQKAKKHCVSSTVTYDDEKFKGMASLLYMSPKKGMGASSKTAMFHYLHRANKVELGAELLVNLDSFATKALLGAKFHIGKDKTSTYHFSLNDEGEIGINIQKKMPSSFFKNAKISVGGKLQHFNGGQHSFGFAFQCGNLFKLPVPLGPVAVKDSSRKPKPKVAPQPAGGAQMNLMNMMRG
eukprot:TRINITY_DN62793_c0_g1_i1.p1 TRINITY_DN62793_c0_g1~~TRINITY_DN62793_c0_g1_i1.p1  ORF type:complete len:351 (+),score=113.88 TRINITY_DN62793_c0_g1_i1:76-1128(+)